MDKAFPQGTVHQAGDDLEAAVRSDPHLLGLWEKLTPLGRNEFICWVEDAKQPGAASSGPARNCWKARNVPAAGPDASTAPTRHAAAGNRPC